MSENDVDQMMHDGGWAAWQARLTTMIAQYGQTLIGVFNTPEDGPGPGFTYTIGLTPHSGFEIIVFGLPYEIAAHFLNLMGEQIRAGKKYPIGQPIAELANLPLMLVQTDERVHGYVCQADRYYGKEVVALQLVLPDRSGNFPGQSGYDEEYMGLRQPLLYTP